MQVYLGDTRLYIFCGCELVVDTQQWQMRVRVTADKDALFIVDFTEEVECQWYRR
jgi:hypothetical protein